MKQCTQCLEIKGIDEYHKNPTSSTGYASKCKTCRRGNYSNYILDPVKKKNKLAKSREYHKINKQKESEYSKKWKKLNPDKVALSKKKTRIKHKDKISAYNKEYAQKNRNRLNERARERFKQRYHTVLKHDGVYKLKMNTYGLISKAVADRGQRWIGGWRYLPYTPEELAKHLEKQFVGGMSWDNYGEWHVDHIKPHCSYYYTKPTDREFIECWALENLRPLWAIDNLRKAQEDKKFSWRLQGSRADQELAMLMGNQ